MILQYLSDLTCAFSPDKAWLARREEQPHIGDSGITQKGISENGVPGISLAHLITSAQRAGALLFFFDNLFILSELSEPDCKEYLTLRGVVK